MRQRTKPFILLLVFIAYLIKCNFAYAGRYYTGIQIGWDKINLNSFNSSQVMPDTATLVSKPTTINGVLISPPITVNSQTVTGFSTKTSDTAWFANVTLGYEFTCFAALEFGFFATSPFSNSYSATTATSLTGTIPGGSFTYSGPFNVQRTDTLQLFVFDLAYKAILPLNDYFDLYAKFGYSLYYQTTKTRIRGKVPTNTGFNSIQQDSSSRRTAPLIALGASYFYSPGISFDFTWTRIIPHIGNKDADQNIDLIGFGFTYYMCNGVC